MKIDAVPHGKDLRGVAGEARTAESLGHDAVWVTEEGTDFAVMGSPEQMPELARKHLSDLVTRVSSYLGCPISDPDRLREILARFSGADRTMKEVA